MFNPPRCPNRNCSFHLSPAPDTRWFARHGQYQPLCRPHPVQRFRCLGCRRRFSRQTFRMDYRDHRPDLNPKLFELLASGVGLRQSSRLLGLSLRCLELKYRKIARHLRRLNLNLQAPLRVPACAGRLGAIHRGGGLSCAARPGASCRAASCGAWAGSARTQPR